MAVEPDLIAGMITLTNGSDEFTGVGTSWLLSGGRAGDMIIDLPGTPYQGVVKEITSDTAGLLTKPWDGPTLTAAYRYRFQPDGSRVPAEARNLIELLGNGNLQAMADLTGSASTFAMFTGPGAMVLVPKTDLVSGANYDVQVADQDARDAYDGQAEGFSVLISDMGDGRSAITSRVTATTGVWSDPAYVTGPIGETPDVTIGTVTTGAPGTDAEVTATPTVDGVELDFTIPAGEGFAFVPGGYNVGTAYALGDVVRDAGSSWIALQPTTGNAPPTLPTTSNAYWELMAQKGQDGTGTGDVVGPAGATADRIAVYDGGTGKLLKDGGKTIAELVPANNSITNAILADVPTATIKGRTTGGSGDPEDLTQEQARGVLGLEFGFPLLHVRDAKAVGAGGGTNVAGPNVRVLNTVITNEFGATLASNRVTLPAGTYFLDASAPAFGVARHQLYLVNVTVGADVIFGINAYSNNTTPQQAEASMSGRFTLTASTMLELRHHMQVVGETGIGLGVPKTAAGYPEVYADMKIWKLK